MNIFLLAIVPSEFPSREGASAGWESPRASHLFVGAAVDILNTCRNKLIYVKRKYLCQEEVLLRVQTTLSWVLVMVIHRFSLIADF